MSSAAKEADGAGLRGSLSHHKEQAQCLRPRRIRRPYARRFAARLFARGGDNACSAGWVQVGGRTSRGAESVTQLALRLYWSTSAVTVSRILRC